MPYKNPPQNDSSTGALKHVPKDNGLAKADVEEMEAYDIIEQDIRTFKSDMDPEKTYSALAHMVKDPKYRIIRANNTILLIENKGKGVADGLVFTADTPQVLVKTLKQFQKALITSGFNTLTFSAGGEVIEPVLKRAKIPYTAEKTPEVDGGVKITVKT
jgi:hypothetical protein